VVATVTRSDSTKRNKTRHAAADAVALTADCERFIRVSPGPPQAHSPDEGKGSNMDKLRILPVASVCGLLSIPTLAAPGVYTVDFTAGDNSTGLETVVGTIDLQPGTRGTITSSEILSWSLSSVPGDPAPFSSSSASGATVNCQPICAIVAGQGKLTFTTDTIEGTLTQFSSNIGPINFIGPFEFGPFCNSCLLISPGGPVSGTFPMVSGQLMATRAHRRPKIAIREPQATEAVSGVPEPGTFSLLAFALAGVAIARIRGRGFRRRRSRATPLG